MIDPATIVLGVIALIAVILVAVSFPAVWREHKEWKRRQRLTPIQRAMEDITAAFDDLTTQMIRSFTPAVEAAAAIFRAFADAVESVKVDTEPDRDYSRTRVDVPLETE